jgi:hypothetical protein
MSDAGIHEFRTREVVAGIQHDIWAHWMRYLFSITRHNPDGSVTISAEHVQRWMRQMETDYAYLSERERESDRHQADKVLVAMRPGTTSDAPVAAIRHIVTNTNIQMDDTWKDASLDELRILYAERLKDLECEYRLRCAYENAVEDAMRRNPYNDAMLNDAWNRCAVEINKSVEGLFED